MWAAAVPGPLATKETAHILAVLLAGCRARDPSALFWGLPLPQGLGLAYKARGPDFAGCPLHLSSGGKRGKS